MWQLWQQNISLPQLMESGDMLCFAAFWADQPAKPIFYSTWTHTWEEMVRAAWDLLNEADIVVHYNGRKFDIPWIQRCFAELGLTPPSPYKQVDLWRVVVKEFNFPSSKLEYVAHRLLGMRKLKTSMQLWIDVMNGDPKAQAKMRRYCIKDTKILIPLHARLLPWIANYPSLAVINGLAFSCPKCGSTNLQKRGLAYAQTRVYQQYACNDCGSWSRSVKCEPGESSEVTQISNN